MVQYRDVLDDYDHGVPRLLYGSFLPSITLDITSKEIRTAAEVLFITGQRKIYNCPKLQASKLIIGGSHKVQLFGACGGTQSGSVPSRMRD